MPPSQRQSRTSQAIAQRQQAQQNTPKGENSVYALVQSMGGEFAKALPAHVPLETFLRLALNELRAKPDLLACSPESMLGALMTAARLGLEPGGPLGQFYLTPRRLDGVWSIVPIIGYKGLRDLALRSGKVSSVQSFLIREGDSFAYGSDEVRGFWHEWRPQPDNEDADWTGVLTIAQLRDGGKPVWRHLTRKQVLARRDRGSAGSKGPWHTDTEAMVRKTGIRALIPDLPSSSVLAEANRVDETVQVWRIGQDEPHQLEPSNPNPQPEVEAGQQPQQEAPDA